MAEQPLRDAEKVRTWGATLTRPPRRPAPKRGRWISEWTLSDYWTYDGERTLRGKAWFRDYLQLDGHEDCCHHTWQVYVTVGEMVEDPEEDDALIDGPIASGEG